MKLSVDQELRWAVSLTAKGKRNEAAAVYRAILDRFPNNKRARDGLNGLAPPATSPSPAETQQLVALFHQGRLGELLPLLAQFIALHPASVFLHNLAGAACAGTGQLEQAVLCYDEAIRLQPDFSDGWSNRGVALQALGRLDEALASFDMAIRLQPGNVEAYCNRGNVLHALGRRDAALSDHSRAIRLNPDHAQAHCNRGILMKEMQRPGEALDDFDRAIELAPTLTEAHSNRGTVLAAMGRSEDAIASYDQALRLNPDFAEAHNNRGVALFALGRPEEAVTSYDAAIALTPGHADVHYNRGNALQALKRLDEAERSFAAAIDLDPGQTEARNQMLYQQARMCRWDETGVDAASFGIETAPITPFAMLIVDDSAARNLERARAFSRDRYGPAAEPAPAHARNPRIRIGYFSADFHDHATMYLMARLFETHDRERFEIHAFSYGEDRQDAMRRRLVDAVDAFHDVRTLDDRAVAQLARDQRIDIAVDLKGHTQHARAGIFARRAAPIQINYLGYPGSMGADFIDYIIADPVVIPDDRRRFYSEKVIALPGSYQVNDDRRAIADRAFTRAELGLPESGFVFCSFNNNYKISPAEFDIWMRLLGRVEGSVLWLLNDNGWARDNLRREAAARHIDPARLVFAERAALPDHLARHRAADLFLDTFNINAHTTASDALWAGLPLVTKLGDGFPARVAASLLHAIGLPDLVTDSAQAYEALALDLATDPGKLAEVTARLAANRLTTPLFDAVQFTRHIEHGFVLAQDRHLRGQRPDHIEVPAGTPLSIAA